MRILVIEDEDLVRLALCRGLRAAGYETVGAEDGPSGLQAFEACRPDLVITDLVLPRSDGLEVIGRLRKQVPHLAIIAMSGSDEVLLTHAGRLGADRVFPKPFEWDDMLLAIQQLTS